jgi:NAD/NADP transhydrogenase alpha subunit
MKTSSMSDMMIKLLESYGYDIKVYEGVGMGKSIYDKALIKAGPTMSNETIFNVIKKSNWNLHCIFMPYIILAFDTVKCHI